MTVSRTFVYFPISSSTTYPPYSWTAPRYILNMPDTRHERVRKKFHILVDGDIIPPPIKSFREMKLPPGSSHELKKKNSVSTIPQVVQN